MLAILAFAAQVSAQSDDPIAAATEMVASLHRTLEAVAAEYAAEDLDARYAALETVVDATHNVPAIGRFVLRRYWNGLEGAQRAEFIERFGTLSVMNYAARFTSLKQDAFRITDAAQISDSRVRVDAELYTRDDRIVSFVYILIGDDGSWRIVNVVADGVSDLALKRADYSRVMQDKGFDGLLAHVDSQIAALHD